MVLFNIILGLSILLSSDSNKDLQVNDKKGQYLFKITRSLDINEIIYETNTTVDGILDKDEPIIMYWIKYTDNKKREELNWGQRNFGYGLSFYDIKKYTAKFTFIAYDKREFKLKRDQNKKYRVYVFSEGEEKQLLRMHIEITGGTFWFPEISEVRLYLKNLNTGKTDIEIVKQD